MVEIPEKCPLCGRFFQYTTTYLPCDGKNYNYHYKLQWCGMHGYYKPMKKGYELFDFAKRMDEAEKVEPIPPEVLKRFAELKTKLYTLADYEIVKIQCPTCLKEWRQYYLPRDQGNFTCPFCRTEIPKTRKL